MKDKSIRIVSLKLINYAPFNESMGITDFEFDRRKSNNNLVLILGENGSGKSFLMSEFTPEPCMHVGQRTGKRFMTGKLGTKEIVFVVADRNNIDTDEYKCTIVVSEDGKKTNCSFVHKNLITGEEKELNENGNVSSYMDLCKLYLGYDKNYKNIGYLSDDIKNIVSMSYNERNNLMSNWIPSTAEFSTASKIAQKKLNQSNKEIDGLLKDITKITLGDSEKTLKDLQEKLSIKQSKMDQVKDGISKAMLVQTTLSKYTKESLQIKKTDYLNKVKIHNERYNKNADTFNKYSYYIANPDKLESRLHELDKEHDRLIFEEKKTNDEILRLTNEIESSSIPENSDISGYNLISINDSLTRFEKDLVGVNLSIDETIKACEEYSEYTEFSQELHDAISSTINALTNIAIISSKISNVCGNYKFTNIFDTSAQNDVGTQIELLKETGVSLKKQNEELMKLLTELNAESVDFSSFKSAIPKGCDEKKCTLLAALIMRARDTNNSKISETQKKIDENNNKMDELRKQIEEKQILVQNLKNSLFDMRQVVDNLHTLDGKTLYLPKSLKSSIDSPDPCVVLDNVGFLLEDSKKYDEYVSLLEKKKTLEDSIRNLKNISHILTMSEESKRVLQENIEKRKKYNEELKVVVEKINTVDTESKNLNELYKSIQELIVERQELIKSSNSLNEYKQTLLKEGELLYNYRVLQVCISGLRDLETSLNKDILDINNSIEKIKADIISLDTLKTRKKNIEAKRDIYELAYKVWNTRDGYPAMLIKDFLDEVADSANKDLDKSWGGILNVSEFKLDNGEFKIPVIRGDSELVDVAECSKAEKATIGLSISTGIIEASTEDSLYNIVELDETDGGMDSIRRQSFLDNITTRLSDIGCRNVFCVTHNNCFESVSCDVILLKGWDHMISENALSNKNIIFKYDKAI